MDVSRLLIRAKIMQQFIQGEIKVLIATTVIKDGVDVIDATVMVD